MAEPDGENTNNSSSDSNGNGSSTPQGNSVMVLIFWAYFGILPLLILQTQIYLERV